MTQALKNKVAVITAAGQGIGRSCAEQFSKEGSIVWATDINKEALLSLKNAFPEINIEQLDVTDQKAVVDFSKKIGIVNVLLNCVGFVHHGTILECAEKEWDFSFDVNVKSMFRMIQTFLPNMIVKKQGSIINMASVASSIKGVQNRFVYSATKAAVIGLTKSIAIDYIQDGIRCNAICPGTVQTPSLDQRIAAQGNTQTVRESFIARQPMGRFGLPQEIAELAVYLASDRSSFTTGATHVIDGGWTL